MEGWDSWQRHPSDGAIEAEQRVAPGRAVVAVSRAGGEIAFEQTPAARRSTIRGFFPRIAFYDRLQRPRTW